MSKLISMCLYNGSKYLTGAIENIRLAKIIYPDWKLRIYCDADYGLDCETIIMGPSLVHGGMFWRFLPMFEDFDAVIFRDTDSRLNVKERAAVNEWLTTDYNCHAMHDHEHHRCYPLFGGMWGVKPRLIKDEGHSMLSALHAAFKIPQPRVADMDYLRDKVYPNMTTLHHTSVQIKWPSVPFPEVKYRYFVGQQF